MPKERKRDLRRDRRMRPGALCFSREGKACSVSASMMKLMLGRLVRKRETGRRCVRALRLGVQVGINRGSLEWKLYARVCASQAGWDRRLCGVGTLVHGPECGWISKRGCIADGGCEQAMTIWDTGVPIASTE